MIKLPDLKIGAGQYKTIFPYHFKERIDLCGHVDYALLEIRVTDMDQAGNKRPDINTMKTYFHEMVHCIDEAYCMDLLGKEIDKERLVEALAEGLTQVFIDNDLLNKEKFWEDK